MSELKPKNHKNAHGTTLSYVIGFVLSLVFTINAYISVVNKSTTGTRLLATILVFAVLQLAVQVFFFLHLGRGPKPLYNVTFFFGTVSLILVVVLGSIFIMNNLHYNMAGTDVIKKLAQDEGIAQVDGKKTGACAAVGTNYKVTIQDGKISPTTTRAQLCDTLTFINEDSGAHKITFGQQQSYAGQEVSVNKSYPKTITLNQPGIYLFQDSVSPTTAGNFTVAP